MYEEKETTTSVLAPNYLKEFSAEVEDFKSKQIQVVPGLSYNQYETLNRIFYYHNSKFSNRGGAMDPIDEDGDRMYFININKNPCMVCTKAIDFDTKNIRLLTVEGGQPTKTWFMERDLKYWMRDKEFGKKLNRLFKELPVYGSAVWKMIEGCPYFVDLRNFVVDPSADTLDDSGYITELHFMTVPQFRAKGKEMGWPSDKINEAVKKYREMKKTSHIKLIERYGECGELQDNGEVNYTWKRTFVADVGNDEYDQSTKLKIDRAGVVLASEEWEGHPYREFHMGKMPGRWLGVGVVESLFEPQIRVNELANLQTKSSYWAALRVFQTRDGAAGRNLSTDVKNGEVLTTDSEITPVNMEDRNLAFFNDQYNLWLKNRDELTFSYDVVQGERLPAGTPLGSAQIAQAQTLSYFEQIQENVALDIKEVLYEDIIPSFQKESSHEHTLRLVGQDLEEFAEMVKNELVFKEVIRQTLLGKTPTAEEKEVIEVAVGESLKKDKERLITIPKGFYKDVKYDVDIDITGESVDTRVRFATKMALIQFMQADPTATQDPMKRKALFSIAEDGGINPVDFFGVQTKKPEDIMAERMPMGGGGISAPDMSRSLAGQAPQTV